MFIIAGKWLAVTLKWLLHMLWISHHYQTFTECRNEDSVAEIDTYSIFMIWWLDLLLRKWAYNEYPKLKFDNDNVVGTCSVRRSDSYYTRTLCTSFWCVLMNDSLIQIFCRNVKKNTIWNMSLACIPGGCLLTKSRLTKKGGMLLPCQPNSFCPGIVKRSSLHASQGWHPSWPFKFQKCSQQVRGGCHFTITL